MYGAAEGVICDQFVFSKTIMKTVLTDDRSWPAADPWSVASRAMANPTARTKCNRSGRCPARVTPILLGASKAVGGRARRADREPADRARRVSRGPGRTVGDGRPGTDLPRVLWRRARHAGATWTPPRAARFQKNVPTPQASRSASSVSVRNSRSERAAPVGWAPAGRSDGRGSDG